MITSLDADLSIFIISSFVFVLDNISSGVYIDVCKNHATFQPGWTEPKN